MSQTLTLFAFVFDSPTIVYTDEYIICRALKVLYEVANAAVFATKLKACLSVSCGPET